jgi:putative flippase GtrA
MRDKTLIRFIMVGGLCFATNLAVLYGGTNLLGWHYLISMAVSIVIANTLGWLLNRCWTFMESGHPLWVEYARYMWVSFSSTLISLLLMVLCVSVAGIHYMLASAIIALLMLLFNFIAHRDWSFAASERSSTRS